MGEDAALAGVAVADGFGCVGGYDEAALLRYRHKRRHHARGGKVVALGVRVEFADAAQAGVGAALRLARGKSAPRGVDARKAHYASGGLARGADDVVVCRAGQAVVRPAYAHRHRDVHAVGVHGGEQVGGGCHAGLGVGVERAEGGVKAGAAGAGVAQFGREYVGVEVYYGRGHHDARGYWMRRKWG